MYFPRFRNASKRSIPPTLALAGGSRFSLIVIVLFAVFSGINTYAQEGIKPASSGGQNQGGSGISADEANNPAAVLPQIQLQDWYSPSLDGVGSRGSDENLLLLKVIAPVPKIGVLPVQLLRLEVPFLTATANNHTALGDINAFDLFLPINNKTWQVGFGPAVSLPTDTYHFAGSGKWALGPGGAVAYHGIPSLTLVALVYDPISFAGNKHRAAVDTLSFEPFIIKTFSKGFFLRFDPIWTFDMENHAAPTIPLNIGFGRVIPIGHDVINAYIQPEWTVVRPNDDRTVPRFTLRFSVSLLFGRGPKR